MRELVDVTVESTRARSQFTVGVVFFRSWVRVSVTVNTSDPRRFLPYASTKIYTFLPKKFRASREPTLNMPISKAYKNIQ